MCLCQTELGPGILLEEMIKPDNLVFLWPGKWYQCRKPPAGCLFVSGFHKAVHIMAPGMVFFYFHQNCGRERGQAGTNGHDCISLLCISYPYFPALALGNMCLAAVSWRSVKDAVTLAQPGKCDVCTNGFLWASLQPFLLLLQVSDPITLWDQAVQSVCSSLPLPACQTVAEMFCHESLVLPVRKLPRVLGQCYWPAALLQKGQWKQEQWWM